MIFLPILRVRSDLGVACDQRHSPKSRYHGLGTGFKRHRTWKMGLISCSWPKACLEMEDMGNSEYTTDTTIEIASIVKKLL